VALGVLGVALMSGFAFADTTAPAIATSGWQARCVERLVRARDELAVTLAFVQSVVVEASGRDQVQLGLKSERLEYGIVIRPRRDALIDTKRWRTERGSIPLVVPAAPPSEGGTFVASPKMLMSGRTEGEYAALILAWGGGHAAEARFTKAFKPAIDECLAMATSR
jgi:hypothetical protein